MNPFDPGYYTSDELRAFGFARVGEHCFVARNCTIIGLENITLGDHVRIDGFTSIIAPSGRVRIGSRVHVATACLLGARGGLEIEDFSSLSQGVRVFTAIDDFSGNRLSNATVPPEFLGIRTEMVRIGRHVPIGTGSVLLAGTTIEEGAAVGALSLVTGTLKAWTLFAGNPLKEIGSRSREVLRLEEALQARTPDHT